MHVATLCQGIKHVHINCSLNVHVIITYTYERQTSIVWHPGTQAAHCHSLADCAPYLWFQPGQACVVQGHSLWPALLYSSCKLPLDFSGTVVQQAWLSQCDSIGAELRHVAGQEAGSRRAAHLWPSLQIGQETLTAPQTKIGDGTLCGSIPDPLSIRFQSRKQDWTTGKIA